jgi:aminobenzoyl-glutamate transport protein
VTKKGSGFLDRVERIGNALPDPMTLFFLGAVTVFLFSWIATSQGWRSQLFDAEGQLVLDEGAVDLLSIAGFRWLAENLVTIFVGFRPLGLLLAAAIGISVAERSGFLAAALKGSLLFVPPKLLLPATFFTGVMSSLTLDAGYIVLPPLAAAIFKAAGRSPLLGIGAVIAGVGSGFNANLLITGLDPMLAGMTEEAAHILDADYLVNPACNWWFMIVSTFLITFVGWGVTVWFVEPRYARKSPEEGGPSGPSENGDDGQQALTAEEKGGLRWGFGAMAVTLAFLVACASFGWGFLYDAPETIGPGEGQRPFPLWISAIVPLLVLVFLIPGLAYGIKAGTIRSDRDVVRMMSEYMGKMGNYIVLAFFASIFVAAFDRSNLGRMLAIEGGNLLRQFDLPTWLLMIGFIVVTGSINMFIGSMSAKWAMLATVFVPMFMTLGISPELTQVTYRIGDSVTNTISPLNMYLVIVLMYMRQYYARSGIGTLISLMLPYAIAFGIAWALLLTGWVLLGLPLGPGGPLTYATGF